MLDGMQFLKTCSWNWIFSTMSDMFVVQRLVIIHHLYVHLLIWNPIIAFSIMILIRNLVKKNLSFFFFYSQVSIDSLLPPLVHLSGIILTKLSNLGFKEISTNFCKNLVFAFNRNTFPIGTWYCFLIVFIWFLLLFITILWGFFHRSVVNFCDHFKKQHNFFLKIKDSASSQKLRLFHLILLVLKSNKCKEILIKQHV